MNQDEATEATPNAEWDGSHVAVSSTTSANNTSSTHHTDNIGETGNTAYEAYELFRPRFLEGKNDERHHQSAGRRNRGFTNRKEGRYISSRRVPRVTDLALDATLREAAPYQRQRRLKQHVENLGKKQPKIILKREDLLQKVRIRRTRNAVCFVVDASWSMAAEERMQATKAAVFSLLQDAYQRRDYVGLVSFQRTYASVLLPLTNSVELAQRRLQTMMVGGKTPLSRGLLTGYEVLDRACRQNPDVIPLLVVLTDGQANVSMGSLSPQVESNQVAQFIASRNIRSVVIDTEPLGVDHEPALGSIASAHTTHTSRASAVYINMQRGLAHHLARYLQADYYRLEDLRDEGLAHMVRTQLYT